MGNLEPRLQQGYVGGLVVCTQLYPVAREGPKGGKGSRASNIRGEPRISLGALSSDLYHQGRVHAYMPQAGKIRHGATFKFLHISAFN